MMWKRKHSEDSVNTCIPTATLSLVLKRKNAAKALKTASVTSPNSLETSTTFSEPQEVVASVPTATEGDTAQLPSKKRRLNLEEDSSSDIHGETYLPPAKILEGLEVDEDGDVCGLNGIHLGTVGQRWRQGYIVNGQGQLLDVSQDVVAEVQIFHQPKGYSLLSSQGYGSVWERSNWGKGFKPLLNPFAGGEVDRRVDYIRENLPDENSGAFKEIFLCHARLYVFGERYDIKHLQSYSWDSLYQLFHQFTPERRDNDALISLFSYVYRNTLAKVTMDPLRELVVRYLADDGRWVLLDPQARLLLNEIGDFAVDMTGMLVEALGVSEGI